MKHPVCALLLFAGESTRMGQNKLLMELGGRTVMERSFFSFYDCPEVDELVLVTGPQTEGMARALQKACAEKPVRVADGGATRQQSVHNGLLQAKGDIVLIHDGARCFASRLLILECIISAIKHGSGVAGVKAVDTVWENGQSPKALDRKNAFLAQTPQAFDTKEILAAYDRARAKGEEATDDAGIFAAAGGKVRFVEGSPDNFKLTLPSDIPRANALLGVSEVTRVGTGEDYHAFAPGRRLVLCGVEIPHPVGLAGHSDADAAVHALCDALLGALALGDIGGHFPDSDPAYKGANSLVLLKRVYELVRENGGRMQNADITICAQAPKLAPYIAQMREALAGALGEPVGKISVKATTTEGMGFVGRGEGIEARAVVCVLVVGVSA